MSWGLQWQVDGPARRPHVEPGLPGCASSFCRHPFAGHLTDRALQSGVMRYRTLGISRPSSVDRRYQSTPPNEPLIAMILA